ncbi:MAG TPA: RNA polymerase factor sigma-54 [Verrucomicrobiae bacterium]|nr:RNA polymerase factor sigma-54 [Verrucomicrobiae bacterium]
MAGPGLHQVQRMSLQQILAPQLQQSLHLLQVPTLELRSLVQEELQQNPLLEEIPKDEPQVEIESPDGETVREVDADKEAVTAEERAEFKEEFEVLAKLDEEWRDYFSQTNTVRSRSPEQEEQRQHFFDSIVQQESLQQHLLQQLNFAALTEDRRKVAELIVGSINDDGYLLTPIEELAVSSGIPLDHLQEALELVQTFHPVGVGARNLKECLLIQLDRLGKSESIEAVLVNQHLDDLGRKRFPEIARAMNLSVEQIQQLANFISTLEPKPGRMFTTEQQQYVAADVVVQKIGDDYVVLLNDEQIPHLRISNTYKELMASDEKSNDAKDYIRDKIRAGKFLIKSIHQRQQTIYNIAKVIVERQREFLENGISCLKPLTMAQVAEVVGVHETTVSRAVANKYMQTPQGLFEMKYFFTPGFETAGGGAMSNTSVKEQISKLIEREDPLKPLSDQEIVAILKEQGIPIARRTVAKYRNELNILPSNLRKTY